MRIIGSVVRLSILATTLMCGTSAALAGSLADCHRPPPAWYTAPRLTHTYSETWGSGYSRASTHEYSAQRRVSSSPPQRYRDPFHRW
jgi:hypothetical protein